MTISLDEIKANREAWYAALESGEYKQTYCVLRDDQGFCCLGVYCLIKDPDPAAWEEMIDGTFNFHSDYNWGLPTDFRESLGMTPAGELRVMELNDKDKLSFPEIAQRLRENPELYFEEGTF